jgi:hypothetical protein
MHSEPVKDGFTGMAVTEDRIRAVMRALDLVLDDPEGCNEDWETYLRRIAISAIEAGRAN